MRVPQFWVAASLMVLTAVILSFRGNRDYMPLSQPLAGLSQNIDHMTSQDIPLDQGVLDVLGKGVFLNRLYQPPANAQGVDLLPIQLFIGYFPTQRTGQSIHSPQHCLPGAGWVFDSSGSVSLFPSGEKPLTVGDYFLSNGPEKAEVLYWYRSHGRNLASDYTAKLYTIYDSLRLGRTDAALIRIVIPVGTHTDREQAHRRLVRFATQLNPLLDPYIPN